SHGYKKGRLRREGGLFYLALKYGSGRVAGGDFFFVQALTLVREAGHRAELGDHATAGARRRLAGAARGGAGVAFTTPGRAVDNDAARGRAGGVHQGGAGNGRLGEGGSGREQDGGGEKSTHGQSPIRVGRTPSNVIDRCLRKLSIQLLARRTGVTDARLLTGDHVASGACPAPISWPRSRLRPNRR